MSVQSVSPGFGQHTAARLGCWTVGAEGRMLVVQHPLRRALCQGHTWTQAQALLWDLALVKMDPLVLIWGSSHGPTQMLGSCVPAVSEDAQDEYLW